MLISVAKSVAKHVFCIATEVILQLTSAAVLYNYMDVHDF